MKFYDIIIKCDHYPERWLKVVDVMTDKGKEPKLGKLRITQLIETDLQLLMIIFVINIIDNAIVKFRKSQTNFCRCRVVIE